MKAARKYRKWETVTCFARFAATLRKKKIICVTKASHHITKKGVANLKLVSD